MRHIFIVNPRSGHQDATPVIQKALSELNPAEPYEIYVTSAPGTRRNTSVPAARRIPRPCAFMPAAVTAR